MEKGKKNYHHGDLRNALIEAALVILREVGPAALSLRAVSQSAGVSGMAPYRHFADKDALLAAVASHGFGLLAQRLMDAQVVSETPRDGLLAQGIAYVRFACEEPDLFRLMFGPVISADTAVNEVSEAGKPAFTVLKDGVRSLLPADGPALAVMELACWSMVHGLASLFVEGKLFHPIDRAMPLDEVEAMTGGVLGVLLYGLIGNGGEAKKLP